jgi:beta-glucosidase
VEPWIDEHADAILEAWYPGQEGGNAIADVLFGDCNPSGRLTISIPKHSGQLPIYYNTKRTRGKRYVETDLKPRYPFGYGLSYTSFHYDDIALSVPNIRPDESCTVSINVTNTGGMAGQEVVQLYVTDVVSSVTRPALELKGFQKIQLEPGETTTVRFTVSQEQLQFVGRDFRRIVEPGQFRIQVGGNADSLLVADLYVLTPE